MIPLSTPDAILNEIVNLKQIGQMQMKAQRISAPRIAVRAASSRSR